MQIHNCHTHVFTQEFVPDNFLPFGLVRFLAKQRVSRFAIRFLNKVLPFTDNDILDRYAVFLSISNTETQKTLFEQLYGCYPRDCRIVTLSMDMEFMGAGRVPKDFRVQLDELAQIKKKYPDNILPFIAVDPRRAGIADIVKEYIEEHDFAGIKLYPPLGYYPFDKRLHAVYEYAQARQLPIITHCAPGGVYFRGTITDDMLDHPKAEEWDMASERKNNKKFCAFFAHPENYRRVFDRFPELKICLGHAGGADEWRAYLDGPWGWHPGRFRRSWLGVILDMLEEYPTLYTDISYLAHDTSLHALLKVRLQDPKIRPKFLFGSDFYMVQRETSERAFSVNLRSFLGESDYQQIADVNPRKFLATKAPSIPRRRPAE